MFELQKRYFPYLVALLIFIDQIVKFWFLFSGAKVSKNAGVALGLLSEADYLSSLVLAVLIVLIFFMLSDKNVFPMSLVVGGGISNLIDRVTRGFVIDYLFLKPLPVFNLADLMVVIGVLLMVFGLRSAK